jgi:hypothetical protein
MTLESPCGLIDDLIQAINTHDEESLAACFASDAIVRDGGLEYRGTAAIRRWIQDTFEKYALRMELTEVSGAEHAWTFEARVFGTFEGSPVRLEHQLEIRGGRVVQLEI